MTKSVQELFEKALPLGPEERAALTGLLIESLERPSPPLGFIQRPPRRRSRREPTQSLDLRDSSAGGHTAFWGMPGATFGWAFPC